MYQVENKSDYWVYNKDTERWLHFESYQELIEWLGRTIKFETYFPDPYYQFNFTGEDLYHQRDYLYTRDGVYVYNEYFCCRTYMVFDAYNRIIDIRLFEQDIRKQAWKEKLAASTPYNSHRKAVHPVGERLYRYRFSKKSYRFRRGPVDGTGKHYGWGRYTPSQRVGRLIRDNDLYRPKARYPMDWWGEDRWHRHCDRSWKSSYKCKHQWEKNMKKKGVYYEQI